MKIGVFVLFLLVSCSNHVNLDPAGVHELLGQKEKLNLFVLNVHTPFAGKLNATDAIIEDWQNLKAHADELPTNKDQPILVYCRSGKMSTSAINQLNEMGYTNLYHADGGMIAYDEAGYVVLDKSWD